MAVDFGLVTPRPMPDYHFEDHADDSFWIAGSAFSDYVGTSSNDVIEIDSIDGPKPMYRVQINGQSPSFHTANKSSPLEVNAGAGDDLVIIRGKLPVLVSGGSGDDVIIGGEGADLLFGGAGNDRIFGGKGNDWLYGGSGDDELIGNEGDDFLLGSSGADRLSGGRGDDLLSGLRASCKNGDPGWSGTKWTFEGMALNAQYCPYENDESPDVIDGGLGSDRGPGDSSSGDWVNSVEDFNDIKALNESTTNAPDSTGVSVYDVNQDGVVSQPDVWAIVNYLHANEFGEQDIQTTVAANPDVSGDGVVSPLDALLIVNIIDQQRDNLLPVKLQASAETIASEQSDELLASKELVDAILTDLVAIAAAHPEVADLRHHGYAPRGMLILDITPTAFERFLDGRYEELEALNEFLGPVKVETQTLLEFQSLILRFEQPFKPELLEKLYSEVDGVEFVWPNVYWGGAEEIIRKEGSTYTYIVGWGDCPAGCINHHWWEFEVNDGTVVLVAQGGEPLAGKHSLAYQSVPDIVSDPDSILNILAPTS